MLPRLKDNRNARGTYSPFMMEAGNMFPGIVREYPGVNQAVQDRLRDRKVIGVPARPRFEPGEFQERPIDRDEPLGSGAGLDVIGMAFLQCAIASSTGLLSCGNPFVEGRLTGNPEALIH